MFAEFFRLLVVCKHLLETHTTAWAEVIHLSVRSLEGRDAFQAIAEVARHRVQGMGGCSICENEYNPFSQKRIHMLQETQPVSPPIIHNGTLLSNL